MSTKLKQIIILYVLCDLRHTEFSEDVKKQVSSLKLIIIIIIMTAGMLLTLLMN